MAWNEPTASSDAAEDPGFMGRLNNSAGAAAKAAEQMERLADRLLGAFSPPPNVTMGTNKVTGLREVPPGLFAEVESRSESISESVERIFTAIRRIEDRLPIN